MRTRAKAAVFVLLGAALVTEPALAVGVDPGAATPAQKEQAQTHFTHGHELYRKQDFAGALTELRASLEVVESPNVRLILARCLRDMGNVADAYAEYGRTIASAQLDAKYGAAQQTATEERGALEAKLGFLTVTVDHAADATSLKVGGREVPRASWTSPVPVTPGSVEVVIESAGQPPTRKTVTVAAGEKSAVTIDAGPQPAPAVAPTPTTPLEPAPDAEAGHPKSYRPVAYVAGGIGVVGMTLFAVFGSLANSKYNDLKSQCGGPCPPSRQSDIDTGKHDQTIANISLAVGAVGIVTGVTLFLTSMPSKSGEAPAASAALVVSPSWIGVTGQL
jgi:hypothetical protein